MDDRPAKFVAETIKRCRDDDRSGNNAFRAAMRRADNPRTAAFAWPHLAEWCDIGREDERLPFALVAAAIARESPDHDGNKDIGQLFKSCCADQDDVEREQRRFGRLVGCNNRIELCVVLRPVLRYLQSKIPEKIGYGEIGYTRLLKDILYYGERVKMRWAANFFGRPTGFGDGENGHVSD